MSSWHIEHVAETGSTNADLADRARRGAADRIVLVAEQQLAGRGRLGRQWVAPAGSALLMSVLVRPRSVPADRRHWVGALLAMAVAAAIESRTGFDARLKWPNDVQIRGRKIAGILAEMVGDALIVGSGINVRLARSDLPRADATSLLLEGADGDALSREALRDAILAEFDTLLARWCGARGDVDACGIRADYRRRSATNGAVVAITLPNGDRVTGRALDVAADGSIVLATERGERRFAAGDVTHLRAT